LRDQVEKAVQRVLPDPDFATEVPAQQLRGGSPALGLRTGRRFPVCRPRKFRMPLHIEDNQKKDDKDGAQRKPRFQIEKLEERIAPSHKLNHPNSGPCTHRPQGCGPG
jgi:hypothetical protein